MVEFLGMGRKRNVVAVIAAGFVVGGTLSKLLEGFVFGIVDPLVGAAFNQPNLQSQTSFVNESQISWGVVLSLLINFLVAVGVVYSVYRFMNMFHSRKNSVSRSASSGSTTTASKPAAKKRAVKKPVAKK